MSLYRTFECNYKEIFFKVTEMIKVTISDTEKVLGNKNGKVIHHIF